MKKLIFSLFVAFIATTALWASNVISYTATEKLPEVTTDGWAIGLHTNAFNVAITSHEFSNGTGTITFAGEVTIIGYEAFTVCEGLTSIEIPNSVTTIGERAFSGCRGLTSVTIPNSVTTIGVLAFYECVGLTSVTIGNSVTEIGEFAFAWCENLTSIVIPNSVTTIGEYAFEVCSGLTSLTIGSSVATIGERAFLACNVLTSIICYAVTPPECGDDVFEYISQDAKVYVPASALTDYQSAKVWKDMLLLPIAADVTPMDDENPIVIPTDQDVTITWPITDGADTYTLIVSKNGKVVCTLTFNAQGQLLNIAFAAPSHNGAHQAPAATLTAQGYQFTVMGLNPGTAYTYSVTATDAGGQTLAEHKGNFSTTGGGTPTSINEVHGSQCPMRKYFHNGNLIIERNGVKYTATGQKVK